MKTRGLSEEQGFQARGHCFEVLGHKVLAENGVKSLCCGLILTSRFAFCNVLYAHNSQQHDGIIGHGQDIQDAVW